MRQQKLIAFLIVIVIFAINHSTPACARIIFQDNFDHHDSSITGWITGAQVYLEKSGGVNNSQHVRVNYTHQHTLPYVFSKLIGEHNLTEIYVRFYFKVGPNAEGGSKFLKLFGKRDDPIGYANTTFTMQYETNRIFEASYGRGTKTVNDTQDYIRFNGKQTDPAVTINTYTSHFSPTIGYWHCFEVHMRYNDDNRRNGIYRVWIDGRLRVHATNVINRHNSNSRFFGEVALGNYGAHGKSDVDWNLHYDELVISTQYIGPMGSTIQSRHP
jgi:hypothetical protein